MRILQTQGEIKENSNGLSKSCHGTQIRKRDALPRHTPKPKYVKHPRCFLTQTIQIPKQKTHKLL